jgi:outer membrane protein assembly factor BamD
MIRQRGPLRHILHRWLCFFILFSIGCGTTSGHGQKVSYQDTARENYYRGVHELQDESYPEALNYFTFVKTKFPFSRFATLAELRMADTYYAQEKYLEAIDAYKLFLKFHPIHPDVQSGYVSYRICEANMKQMPSDWFLIPHSYEKDQAATKEALRELVSFLRTHNKSKYLSEVKKLYRECVRRLADHELYVARFYLDRKKPKAAIFRLETLLQQYPDAGMDPEVMLLLGQTYMMMEKKDKAKETFAKLIEKYPKDAHSAKAKRFLKSIVGQ